MIGVLTLRFPRQRPPPYTRVMPLYRHNSQHDTTVICMPLSNLQQMQILLQGVTARQAGSPVFWSHLSAGCPSRLRPSAARTYFFGLSCNVPYFIKRVCSGCPLLVEASPVTTSDPKPETLVRFSTLSPHPPLLDPENPQLETFPLPISRGHPPSHHLRKDAEGVSLLRSGSGGRGRPWRREAGKVAPKVPHPGRATPEPCSESPGRPGRGRPRPRPGPPLRLGGDPAGPLRSAPRRRAAGLGGRQQPPTLPGPQTLGPGPAAPLRSGAPATPAPGRQSGRPHLRHSPPPPSPPPPPPSSSMLRPLPLPASPGPRAVGAAGAERAGGRAAPAARAPGRGPGLLRPGGALAARRSVT